MVRRLQVLLDPYGISIMAGTGRYAASGLRWEARLVLAQPFEQ